MSYRTGLVAIAGCPNVGKSSFMNHVLGQKVSITSRKADTTRYCTQGIVTTADWQCILMDTPGYAPHPTNALQRSMQKTMRTAFSEADLLIWMADVRTLSDPASESLAQWFPTDKPVVLMVNKVDLVHDPLALSSTIDRYRSCYALADTVSFSALSMTPSRFNTVFSPWSQYLPEHPPLYEADALTDRPMAFIAAEMIREKLHRLLGQELPYRVAVTIDRYQTEETYTDIQATIWVSKVSHRAMILGKQGVHIKRMSIAAREDIERLLARQVMLRLWVKVKERWMDHEQEVSRLYHVLTTYS